MESRLELRIFGSDTMKKEIVREIMYISMCLNYTIEGIFIFKGGQTITERQ
jgi:hypothetical protein